jgi:predicted nucleotidyltransferase
VLKKVLNPKEGDILPIEGLKKMMIKELKKVPIIEAVLFGSVAREEEKPGSDIDLFLLVKSNAEKNIVEKAVRNLDDRIRELYGNGLGEYILTEKEYAQKSGLGVILNIKKEGIKLI